MAEKEIKSVDAATLEMIEKASQGLRGLKRNSEAGGLLSPTRSRRPNS